jgi:hypothetical protein
MASAMCLGSRFGGFEVGDGAGDFQDAVVGAGAEALLGHGAFEQAFAIGGERAGDADVAGGHLGVAVQLFFRRGEAFELFLAGANDAVANLGGGFRLVGGAHFFVVHGGNVDVDIDAVHERAGDFRDVALDHGSGAVAFATAVVVEAAGAGIHGGGQHEARGEGERHGRAGDADRAVFEGLAQDFEDVAGKFGKLVEERAGRCGRGKLLRGGG